MTKTNLTEPLSCDQQYTEVKTSDKHFTTATNCMHIQKDIFLRHVSLTKWEADPLTYGILVLVRVDASVHDASKQVVHDAGQRLSVQHAMQRTNKHSLTGVQTLGGATHIVAVRDHPGDHLNLHRESDQRHRSQLTRYQTLHPCSSTKWTEQHQTHDAQLLKLPNLTSKVSKCL